MPTLPCKIKVKQEFWECSDLAVKAHPKLRSPFCRRFSPSWSFWCSGRILDAISYGSFPTLPIPSSRASTQGIGICLSRGSLSTHWEGCSPGGSFWPGCSAGSGHVGAAGVTKNSTVSGRLGNRLPAQHHLGSDPSGPPGTSEVNCPSCSTSSRAFLSPHMLDSCERQSRDSDSQAPGLKRGCSVHGESGSSAHRVPPTWGGQGSPTALGGKCISLIVGGQYNPPPPSPFRVGSHTSVLNSFNFGHFGFSAQ